jgi:hypothetical protein
MKNGAGLNAAGRVGTRVDMIRRNTAMNLLFVALLGYLQNSDSRPIDRRQKILRSTHNVCCCLLLLLQKPKSASHPAALQSKSVRTRYWSEGYG